jgi:demethylmenaquinone methyltransferase/2-methoxy-6-polyprenyl-1,4-benzoquinol methylase
LSKGPGVQKMFDAIAGRYDVMNRVMTLGQDQKWRRFVVKKAGDPKGRMTLDLATGTGDIAALMADTYSADVIGADFSLNMLMEARNRFAAKSINWQACDANTIPFVDGVFDSVTFGYLLRNVDDTMRVLKEVFRVLRPGGRVVCLDTTPPAKNMIYPFLQFYFRFCIPAMGKFIADDETAYTYLTGSTMEFYEAEELSNLFKEAGFMKVSFKKFMFGTIAVHWGEKE